MRAFSRARIAPQPRPVDIGASDGGRRMANDEHLMQLSKGADAWNAWRRAKPAILRTSAGRVIKFTVIRFP